MSGKIRLSSVSVSEALNGVGMDPNTKRYVIICFVSTLSGYHTPRNMAERIWSIFQHFGYAERYLEFCKLLSFETSNEEFLNCANACFEN